MNPAVLAAVFGIIFVAELPDKTALASLVLGTRYGPGTCSPGRRRLHRARGPRGDQPGRHHWLTPGLRLPVPQPLISWR
jgi:hypothetical protein